MVPPEPTETLADPLRPQRLQLTQDLSLYLIEEEAVLFSGRSRRLFALDTLTTVLLLRLAEGEPVAGVAASLRLNASGVAVAQELSSLLAGDEPAPELEPATAMPGAAEPQAGLSSPFFRLLSTVFTVDCLDGRLGDALRAGLGQLRLPVSDESEPFANLAVTVERLEDDWCVRFNGAQQGNIVPTSMVLPLVYGRLRRYALQQFPFFMAIHAAAITDGSRTIVFPGGSGFGKSTLVSALLRKGFRLISDELAVLDEDQSLVSMPYAVSLKSGSWEMAEKNFPGLAMRSAHLRWDGLNVKYLDPGDYSSVREGERLRATHLCFPRFRARQAGELKALRPVASFRALHQAGFQARELTLHNAERIIEWILALRCFAMSYSTSDEALDQFKSVLAA